MKTKHQHIFKFFISLCFILVFVNSYAQLTHTKEETKQDSIIYKTNYGIRVGLDVSRPIRGLIQDFYSGFELVADYRISDKWYVATEFGTEEQTTNEDFTNSTSKGQFIRLGMNYNSYNNWMNMNNEVYLGFRYGFSLFEQTLNSYQINTGNTVFNPQTITTSINEDGLTAHWLELMIGIKAEVYDNVFIGISGSYKILASVDTPTNFMTHFAPGFNRVYLSNTGFGVNYTISYLIPFRKK